MREFVAVVFNQSKAARRALHELWRLHHDALLSVHGAGVVFRKADDEIAVDVGATVGAAGGAAIGAAGGAVGGVAADIADRQTTKQAMAEVGSVLPTGHYALIADVDESDPHPLTAMASSFGGKLYRRNRSDVSNDMYDNLFGAFKPYRYSG